MALCLKLIEISTFRRIFYSAFYDVFFGLQGWIPEKKLLHFDNEHRFMLGISVCYFGACWDIFTRFFAFARIETFVGFWRDLVCHFPEGHSSGLQLLTVLLCRSQSLNWQAIIEECGERNDSSSWSFESVGALNLGGSEHCQCSCEHIMRAISLDHSS